MEGLKYHINSKSEWTQKIVFGSDKAQHDCDWKDKDDWLVVYDIDDENDSEFTNSALMHIGVKSDGYESDNNPEIVENVIFSDGKKFFKYTMKYKHHKVEPFINEWV